MPTMVTVNCAKCGKEFEVELRKYNASKKENSNFYCSNECYSHRGSQLCECANCGKLIWRTNSQIKKSKTGNVYCSRSCSTSKNNTLFKTGEDHPNYLGNNYRKKAFDNYVHACHICNWDEDEDILEVHHINENHSDNDINNLMILCPICHRKLTSHKYKLSEGKDNLEYVV